MHDDFYQMYLEELGQIAPCGREEEEQLLKLLNDGDVSARKRLIEGNLSRALSYAREYEDRGVLLTDLVQEANVALTAAVNSYSEGSFLEYTEGKVRAALEDAVRFQAREKEAGEELAARVNVLQEVSKTMAAKLGREATVEELAKQMKMSQEEIKEIMKITIDALSIQVED